MLSIQSGGPLAKTQNVTMVKHTSGPAMTMKYLLLTNEVPMSKRDVLSKLNGHFKFTKYSKTGNDVGIGGSSSNQSFSSSLW
jgi:hypothetical protein